MTLDTLILVHYDHPNCTPMCNIVRLPEKEAFALARQLAGQNKGVAAFHRFADFQNYYPLRMRADQLMRQAFISLGGHPVAEHPLSFVLQGSDYLVRWFDKGPATVIPMNRIPDEAISFTYGDSCSTLLKNGRIELVTKSMLLRHIQSYHGDIGAFMQAITDQYHYIEVQIWNDVYCQPDQTSDDTAGDQKYE